MLFRGPTRHIIFLYIILGFMLIMSSQRHSQLQKTMKELKTFQEEGRKLRMHLEADHQETERRLANVEKFHGVKYKHPAGASHHHGK